MLVEEYVPVCCHMFVDRPVEASVLIVDLVDAQHFQVVSMCVERGGRNFVCIAWYLDTQTCNFVAQHQPYRETDSRDVVHIYMTGENSHFREGNIFGTLGWLTRQLKAEI